MDQESLRLLIQGKIRDGRLPHDGITKVWSSPSAGETCDACDTILAKDQLVMEGETPRLAIAGSSSSTPPTLPAASGVALYAEPEEHGEQDGHHEAHQHKSHVHKLGYGHGTIPPAR